MNRVAVVILNYNGAEMLKRFLPTVMEFSSGAQIIVADNASTDDSVAVLQKLFPTIELIRLNENWGFAQGYNLALEQVDADYFILLNSDVEVTKGWIEPMLEILDSNPDVAACQPKLLDYKRKTHFEYAGAAGGFIDCYGYPYCRGRIMETVEEDKGQYDSVCDLFWATGAALMIRAEDYRAAGGLDGRFFAHMEEIDLCWRLRARGRRILCVPQSFVYHVGGATLSYNNPRKVFLNFRNNLLMLHKNLPEKDYSKIMFVRRILDYVAALKFLVTGDYKSCKAVYKARREFRRIKKEYKEDRTKNLQATIIESIPQKSDFLILWRYYACRCKYFSQLIRK